jgi:orotate phosphoribosyltransferase
MTTEKMLTIDDFKEVGALLEGHFRLSSGLHSDRYLQCARLLMWPDRAERAGRALAGRLAEFSPEAVASPALGGVIIGHEVARALAVRAIFAERKDGAFALRRGFSIAPDERVAVVEDVFTTGGSTREVCETVEAAGGRVVAVGSLVDRGAAANTFSVPARSVLSLRIPAWAQEDCPLCARGVALDTPGSRYSSG